MHAYGSAGMVLFSVRGLTTPYPRVVNEGGATIDEPAQFVNATWTHLCLVVINSPVTAIMYNNDSISGMSGVWGNTTLANTATGYGMGPESGTTTCQIELDDAKIYSRALSVAEILAMSKQ
jgi:hypothetical protein